MKTYVLDDFKIGDVVKLNTADRALGEITRINKKIEAIYVLMPDVGVINYHPNDVITKYVKEE